MPEPNAESQPATPPPPRRKLRFETWAEVLADAERLADGPVVALGKWTPGQIFLHLARGLDLAIDGAPPRPWYVRFVGRWFLKRRFLTATMSPGWKPPAASLTPGDTSPEAGLRALRSAIARYERVAARRPHPIFGALSAAEWNALQLRHAELHLGFLLPSAGGPK